MQSSSADQISRIPQTQPTRQATRASESPSRAVISESQASAIATNTYEMTPVSGALAIRTQGELPTAAQNLDRSIEARLQQVVRPKQRNEAHMVAFLNALRTIDLESTDKNVIKANKAALSQAVKPFIQAYFASLEEVEGPQRVAGKILNMHNWQAEVFNMLTTLAIWGLSLGVEFTKIEPADPSHPPAIAQSKLPGLVPNAIGLPLLLVVMYINGTQGAKYIQHALAMQRATRVLTPTRAGGLVDLKGARDAMKIEHGETKKLKAQEDVVTPEQRHHQIERLKEARNQYRAEQGTLAQRNDLYFQENVVKAGKAAVLLSASLSTIFTSGYRIARIIPQVLLAQAVAYPAGWAANYLWAGPERDNALRDGALKVDFEKGGVAHAHRLSQAQGGGEITSVPENDEVWTFGRSLYKNQLQIRLEMLQTRVVEKLEDEMHGMSKLMGISDDDLLRYETLGTKWVTTGGELDPAEQAEYDDLETRFNDSPLEAAYRYETLQDKLTTGGELNVDERREYTDLTARFREGSPDAAHLGADRTAKYATHRAAWEVLNVDRMNIATFLKSAAKDEPSEVWREFSPATKEMFNHHLSAHFDENAWNMYTQYRKGLNSDNEFVRFTREVSDVTVRDWRLLDADKNLKLNRPFAYGGLGGSLGTIIKGQALGLVKNTTGYSLPPSISAPISGLLFGLYVHEIFKQGQAVNLTISQKEANKAVAPSKHDPANKGWMLTKNLLKGTVITSTEGVNWVKGKVLLSQVNSDITELSKGIDSSNVNEPAPEAVQEAEQGSEHSRVQEQ